MQFRFEGDERSVLIARFGLQASASDTDIGTAVQRHLLASEQGGNGGNGGDNPPAPAPTPASDPGERPAEGTPPTTPGGDPGSGGTGGTGPVAPEQEPSPGSGTDQPDDEQVEGMVLVDEEALSDLERRAGIAARLQEEDRVRTRDELIANAIRSGRFPPSRRTHYANLYDADPEGTTRQIGRLRTNIVPLEARGVEPSEDEVRDDSYPTEWLPERQAAAAATNGAGRQVRQSRVITED